MRWSQRQETQAHMQTAPKRQRAARSAAFLQNRGRLERRFASILRIKSAKYLNTQNYRQNRREICPKAGAKNMMVKYATFGGGACFAPRNENTTAAANMAMTNTKRAKAV